MIGGICILPLPLIFMKKLLIILIWLSLLGKAQTQLPESIGFDNKNSVNIELGGHGIVFSTYYERIIFNGKRFKTTGQIGYGVIPSWVHLMPFLINEMISLGEKKTHHIEIGLGITYVFRDKYGDLYGRIVFLNGRIGYRFQRPDGKLIIRAGYTPLSDSYDWFGLSFGYAF